MSNKAIAEFADALLQHFPPFRQWEEYQEKAWADTLASELAGFSGEILARAQKRMIATRKPNMPKPPMVSECIDACVEAKRWIDAERQANSLPMGQHPAVSTDEMKWNERKALANSLVKCPLGQQAAREGWIGELHAYAVKNGRLPPENEYGALKRNAKETDVIAAMVFRGEAPNKSGEILPIPAIMRPVLEKFASSVLSNRQELERMVIG